MNLEANTERVRKPYTKRTRTLAVLIGAGLIGPGTRIVVHRGHLDGIWPPSVGEAAKHAQFGRRLTSRTNVIWDLDDGEYSLTELRDRLIDLGVPFTSGLTYMHWALEERPETSLWDLAEQIGR